MSKKIIRGVTRRAHPPEVAFRRTYLPKIVECSTGYSYSGAPLPLFKLAVRLRTSGECYDECFDEFFDEIFDEF